MKQINSIEELMNQISEVPRRPKKIQLYSLSKKKLKGSFLGPKKEELLDILTNQQLCLVKILQANNKFFEERSISRALLLFTDDSEKKQDLNFLDSVKENLYKELEEYQNNNRVCTEEEKEFFEILGDEMSSPKFNKIPTSLTEGIQCYVHVDTIGVPVFMSLDIEDHLSFPAYIGDDELTHFWFTKFEKFMNKKKDGDDYIN